jgi:murein DD-endopeptidase MepM/ murein hydrolase activator NlpD
MSAKASPPVRVGVGGTPPTRPLARPDKIQDQLKAAHVKALKAAIASGPAGKAGHVLPAGSYSIGMPYHGYPGHNGADYPAAIGTPVSSPWPGRVTTSADLPGSNPYNSTPYRSYGRYIKIQHTNGLQTLYAHLSARGVRVGQVVNAGQFIGRVGMNGNATGPHLHLEAARNGVTFDPASLHLMDTGGMLKHGGAAVNMSGRNERVLTPRQTDAFERLVTAMESGAASGGNQFTVVEASSPGATAREIARMQAFAGAH